MTIDYNPENLLFNHPVLFVGAIVSLIGWIDCEFRGRKKAATMLGLTASLCIITLVHARAEDDLIFRDTLSRKQAYATAAALADGHADAVAKVYIDFLKTSPMVTSRQLDEATLKAQGRLEYLLKGTNKNLTFWLSDELGKSQVRWRAQ